jgi:hypothetical protein
MFVYLRSGQEEQRQSFQDLVDLETKRIYIRISESENVKAALNQDTWLHIRLGRLVKYTSLTYPDA